MQEILKLFKDASPTLIILVVISFFLKTYIEKRLEGIAGRIEEINKTSLDVKRELRGQERGELVTFRVAVEKWEYFLQTALFDYSITNPLDADIKTLYEKDRDLFLDVKIAIVKSCTYLRDKELEDELMSTVMEIRKNYYPVINELMPRMIDIQSKLMFFENKLAQFQKSGMTNMAFAPTEQDREEYNRLQNLLTEELAKFSTLSTEKYKEIAVQLNELKESMNHYIYRPIEYAAINRD